MLSITNYEIRGVTSMEQVTSYDALPGDAPVGVTTPVLRRILMVEDEEDIQVVASLALEAVGGYEVQVCSSGMEAIAQAPQIEPDLLLLDVMMPEMDGPSTLRALRQLPGTAHTPVIFMTAKVQPQEVAHYKELGAIGVVSKPFDPMTLAATINDIWTNHHV
jgi:CheY-like chemotaxis protein